MKSSAYAITGALLLLAMLLSGCTQEPEPTSSTAGQAMQVPDSSQAPLSHAHDYYGSLKELTLMDSKVSLTVVHNHLFDQPPRQEHTHGCEETLISSSQGGSVKFSLPPGNIVPPGTDHLDVTVSWSDASITGVRLMYRPPSHDHGPSEHQHMEHNDFMDAGPVENGQATTIPVTPNITDQGHQFHSNWAFFLCADGDDPLQLAQGTVNLLIIAYRADEIPIDPPHPDRWLNRTRLLLGSLDWSGSAISVANQGDAWFHIPLDEGAVVPWGTDHVLVRANLTGNGALDDVYPFDVSLWYRDASSVEWNYERVQGEGPATERVFTIPIDKGDLEDMDALDSPYAQRSHWDFWLRVSSATGADAPVAGYWTAPHVFEGSLEASVWAVATPL